MAVQQVPLGRSRLRALGSGASSASPYKGLCSGLPPGGPAEGTLTGMRAALVNVNPDVRAAWPAMVSLSKAWKMYFHCWMSAPSSWSVRGAGLTCVKGKRFPAVRTELLLLYENV